jgi:hypothetical protein
VTRNHLLESRSSEGSQEHFSLTFLRKLIQNRLPCHFEASEGRAFPAGPVFMQSFSSLQAVFSATCSRTAPGDWRQLPSVRKLRARGCQKHIAPGRSLPSTLEYVRYQRLSRWQTTKFTIPVFIPHAPYLSQRNHYSARVQTIPLFFQPSLSMHFPAWSHNPLSCWRISFTMSPVPSNDWRSGKSFPSALQHDHGHKAKGPC